MIGKDVEYFEAGAKTVGAFNIHSSREFLAQRVHQATGPFDEQFGYSSDADFWPRLITRHFKYNLEKRTRSIISKKKTICGQPGAKKIFRSNGVNRKESAKLSVPEAF